MSTPDFLYQRVKALENKCEKLQKQIDQVENLITRSENEFNANAILDDDQNPESDILSDIFYSWKEIFKILYNSGDFINIFCYIYINKMKSRLNKQSYVRNSIS